VDERQVAGRGGEFGGHRDVEVDEQAVIAARIVQGAPVALAAAVEDDVVGVRE